MNVLLVLVVAGACLVAGVVIGVLVMAGFVAAGRRRVGEPAASAAERESGDG